MYFRLMTLDAVSYRKILKVKKIISVANIASKLNNIE